MSSQKENKTKNKTLNKTEFSNCSNLSVKLCMHTNLQGSKGISQWTINSCTKIIPSEDYN